VSVISFVSYVYTNNSSVCELFLCARCQHISAKLRENCKVRLYICGCMRRFCFAYVDIQGAHVFRISLYYLNGWPSSVVSLDLVFRANLYCMHFMYLYLWRLDFQWTDTEPKRFKIPKLKTRSRSPVASLEEKFI